MRSYDLTPLFRSTVGFDDLFRLLDATTKMEEQAPSYPPYNIEKLSDDSYRISMAVAGFTEEDLSILAHGNTLVVSGRQKEEAEQRNFLHRGIARLL